MIVETMVMNAANTVIERSALLPLTAKRVSAKLELPVLPFSKPDCENK
jgi:hypothetical protein